MKPPVRKLDGEPVFPFGSDALNAHMWSIGWRAVQEVAVLQAASEHMMHEWTERVRPFLSVVARGDRPVEEEEVKLDDSAQRILTAMPSGEIRRRAALKAVRRIYPERPNLERLISTPTMKSLP